ncbi:regulator, partial [Vibrio parahaemolyticus]
GVALLELGASNDIKVAHQILKYARVLKKIV